MRELYSFIENVKPKLYIHVIDCSCTIQIYDEVYRGIYRWSHNQTLYICPKIQFKDNKSQLSHTFNSEHYQYSIKTKAAKL